MRQFLLCSQIKDSTIWGFFQFVAAEKFLRSPSEGVAEGGGWGEEFRHARAFRRAKRGGSEVNVRIFAEKSSDFVQGVELAKITRIKLGYFCELRG